MPIHPTTGFKINAPPQELLVVVDELFRPISDLDHAPTPLRGIREVVASKGNKAAARRFLREMRSTGVNPSVILQRMNELTPFTEIRIEGEFAALPPGTAFKATNAEQTEICERALLMARGREVEGFELDGENQERPRLLLLPYAFEEAVEIVNCHMYVPAHFFPDDNCEGELFAYGRPSPWHGPNLD